jgi:hypothetical protein
METPPPDPAKLLEVWMEWERGDTTPGRVMSSLKTGGMRDLLEELVAAGGSPSDVAGEERATGSADTWTPVV